MDVGEVEILYESSIEREFRKRKKAIWFAENCVKHMMRSLDREEGLGVKRHIETMEDIRASQVQT
jgi:hypothetical protein